VSGAAELIADRGEAAAAEEFFRSRPFLDAEGVTHTLRIEAGDRPLIAPLVVREISGTDRRDATSPYGYPGLVSEIDPTGRGSISDAPPLDPATIDFAPTGLVAVFLRHTLGDPPLTGASERNVVQIADPREPAKSRPSDRNQINRNRREGYEIRVVRGAETAPEDRAGFVAAYEQTMRRANADQRYFFGATYFDRILEADRAWLALADAPDGSIAAGSVTVESDGFLHYYLSGSTDANLRDSPMKNVVAALVELAGELEMPLNLGGGITRGDRLEEFKRGFANREQPWHTSELVCDSRAYANLSGGRGEGRYFPAYRAPRQ
jgi:hypothetical protein